MCLLFSITQNHTFIPTHQFQGGNNIDTTATTTDSDNYSINIIAMLYTHTLTFLSQNCIWLIMFGLKW